MDKLKRECFPSSAFERLAVSINSINIEHIRIAETAAKYLARACCNAIRALQEADINLNQCHRYRNNRPFVDLKERMLVRCRLLTRTAMVS